MKLNITGDLVITEKYLGEDLFSLSVKQIFQKDNRNIVNLECPIIENKYKPIEKTGPNIFTKKQIINHLKELNINVTTLANNHILDFGDEGLLNTCNLLKSNNIKYVGVGSNLKEAKEPLILEKEDLTVGIINFCENEWSIAGDFTPGANPVNIIDNYKQINYLKDRVDHLIVIHHGGHELHPYPSPRMKELFRFYIDIGADIVVNHHTHCISGYECYKDKAIFYSLGNFLFTSDNRDSSWYEGLILSLTVTKADLRFELIPVIQDKQTRKLSVCEPEDKSLIMKRIVAISEVISEDTQLQNKFNEYLQKNIKRLRLFSPINFLKPVLLKRVFFKLGFDKLVSYEKFYLSFLNNLRCESHYDVLIKLIEQEVKNENSNS